MAAAANAGGGGATDLTAFFQTALDGARQSQEQELAFNTELNQLKAAFQAESSKLLLEDAMITKMSTIVAAQARALSQ